MILKIDKEFKDLIPPLSAEEYRQLEENILKDGCRDPLVLWDGVILDGHNRYKICTEHSIEFKTVISDLPDRQSVIIWIIKNQFGRRNLPNYERAKLALRLKPIITEQARENLVLAGKSYSPKEPLEISTKVYKKIDTRKELSEMAGVSDNTIAKVEKIEAKATEAEKKSLSAGETTINKVYTNIVNKERKEELKAKTTQTAERYKDDDAIKIVQSDCIEYLKNMEDESVDLIVIDPPYYGIVGNDWDNQWKDKEEYLSWCMKWMKESFRVLKSSGNFYMWGAIGEKSDVFLNQKFLLDEFGFHFKDWITWKKKRGMGNRKGWLYTREECLWYVKDNSKFFWNEDEQYSGEKSSFTEGFSGYSLKSENKRITNVWDDIPEYIGDKGLIHYTPKPLQAIERIIKSCTTDGQIVLDFFGGSGTTAIASKKLNRKCILVDFDINSINETKKRLSDGI